MLTEARLREIIREELAAFHAPKPQQMTATDWHVVLFDLMGTLAEHLTGQRPEVRSTAHDGTYLWIFPNSGKVRWATDKATDLPIAVCRGDL